jgi:hypothetical protein
VKLKINPEGKHDDANKIRKRGTMRQEQEDQLYMYEKPEVRAVMDEVTDAVVSNIEYVTSIKVHQERELNMHEKPEMRKMMIKTNLDSKHDEVRERDNVRQGQAEQLMKVTEISVRVRTLANKSFGDTVFENTLDKDPGKHKAHEKAKKRDVAADINPGDGYMYNVMEVSNVVKKQLYEKPARRDVMNNIIDAVVRNMKYEADVKIHQGRELMRSPR